MPNDGRVALSIGGGGGGGALVRNLGITTVPLLLAPPPPSRLLAIWLVVWSDEIGSSAG